jgi:large subunit ribosomal protein L11
MAKEIKAKVKLQVPAGKATPAPPIGPALGQHGVNIADFVNQFNEKTKDQIGYTIPVELTVFTDRSFTFVTKTPPAADLIKKAVGIQKGSGVPNKNKVGKISRKQLREIAEKKLADLNTNNLDSATKIIEGAAKSLGLEIID